MIEINMFLDVPIEPSDERPPRVISMELDPYYGEALRDLYSGLLAKNAFLNNAVRVESPEDAIRWLLEQVREAKEDHDEDND